MNTLYRCPECSAVWRRNAGVGPWVLAPYYCACGKCKAWVTLQAREDSAAPKPSGPCTGDPQPSTPTCHGQPMQPSTSPYRWDTGELIKGKLLVCRECGEYREAEAGSQPVEARASLDFPTFQLPRIPSFGLVGFTAPAPPTPSVSLPEHAIHNIGNGVFYCFTNVDLDARQTSMVVDALADDAVTFFKTVTLIPPGGQRIDASGKLVSR